MILYVRTLGAAEPLDSGPGVTDSFEGQSTLFLNRGGAE